MFKKLKEKITEEVKISPQRFAEFTQSVSDRLQSTSNSDDNFFSIGEDDANPSTDSNNHGFSSVQLMSPTQERTRKNSTSSLASDVSFLPRYEPGNMYHLQSDLDISASEIEDNVSTASSQLGHLTKEQIYSAFQKSQLRYHKYRGRYTDLSRHYKDLERENAKMKSVLVETQDKAIRRVTELKEQCSLEQTAKAHLESALRNDLEEKNYKIKSLQTKIDLLQNEKSSNALINIEDDGNNLETLTKYLNESRKEIESLNSKIQELKANSIVFQSKEQEYKNKINNLEKEIVQFSEREKENNLNLAQNKMELHNEILLKDNEISSLKRDHDQLKQKLETLEADSKTNNNQKLENLQAQNKKLIEKVENLSQKCNNLEAELLKIETYKLEIKKCKEKEDESAKAIIELEKVVEKLTKNNSELNSSLLNERESYENQITQLREDAKKGLLSLEPKIREKIQNEFIIKEEELQKDFSKKIQELSSTNNTTKEVQIQLFQKDDLIKKLTDELNDTKTKLINKIATHSDLEKDHLDLIENCTELRNIISNLEKDKINLDSQEEKISRLESHIDTLQEELRTSKEHVQEAEKELNNIKEELVETSEQLKIMEEKNETIESQSSNILKCREEETNKIIEDKNEEIQKLKNTLEEKKDKYKNLIEENSNLNMELAKLKETIRLLEEKIIAIEVAEDEAKLMKLKLEQLEEINNKNLESFDKEYDSIIKHIDDIWKELNVSEKETNQEEFIKAELNLKLKILKNLCKKRQTLYNNILEENAKLKEESISKSIQIEKIQEDFNNTLDDNKDMKINIQSLHSNLNEKLKEKEDLLNKLTEQLMEKQNKILLLENELSEEKTNGERMSKENFKLQETLQEAQEKYYLLEKKEAMLEVAKSECGIMELKLQQLEEENKQLTLAINEEKSIAEKTNQSINDSIKQLEFSNKELKEKYENEKTNVQNLNEKMEKLEMNIVDLEQEKEDIETKFKQINIENGTLQKEKEEKDCEILILSENIAKLNTSIENQSLELNTLLEKTQKLDTTIENLQIEQIESIKKEKDYQNDLNMTISKLQTELEEKTIALSQLKDTILELENFQNVAEENSKQKQEEAKNFGNELKTKNLQLKTKDQEIHILKEERDCAVEEINSLRGEIEELHREISQRGNLDTKLVHSESEKELLKTEREKIKRELEELNIRIQQISLDNNNMMEENQSIYQEKEELKVALELLKEQQGSESDKEKLKGDIISLNNTIEDLKKQTNVLELENLQLKNEVKPVTNNEAEIAKIQEDFHEIKEKCNSLFIENMNLKQEYESLEEKCNKFGKIKQKLEMQISEVESLYNDLLKEKQLLEDEVQELKTSPINYGNNSDRLNDLKTLKAEQLLLNDEEKQHYIKEIDMLREKVLKYKSLDLTNKSSIEFYENELQKIKNQNDKLNRKLDETLVTLNHCAELSTSTEVEYLRNVLYNYMLGKESLVLARVIAAVCKFDPQQTELILQKEQQKQTLLGQLGLI
ncbi:golgin subfamily A member 4-like [Diorhabda carinulata]|uniref:golgin subfamily A member 4-like n=1 Tax=Diorhabda carinulata TaxID=1163345 RepID=UPI0025A07E0B|nr:golgin subfamily A member 4-like [Diorhabda carinulata]